MSIFSMYVASKLKELIEQLPEDDRHQRDRTAMVEMLAHQLNTEDQAIFSRHREEILSILEDLFSNPALPPEPIEEPRGTPSGVGQRRVVRTNPEDGRARDAIDLDLLSSPYRFVRLNDTITPAEEQVKKANLALPLDGGFSGKLNYWLEAESPILIGEATESGDEPLKMGNSHVIPGATMRGLIRSACEIVGHGKLGQTNRHHRYPLRDFMHPGYATRGQNDIAEPGRTGWDALRVGFLRKASQFELNALNRGDQGQRNEALVIEEWDKAKIKIRDIPPPLFPEGGIASYQHAAWLRRFASDKYQVCYSVNEAARTELDEKFCSLAQKWKGRNEPQPRVFDFHTGLLPAFEFVGDIDGVQVRALEMGRQGLSGVIVTSNQTPDAMKREYENNCQPLIRLLDQQEAEAAKPGNANTRRIKRWETVFLRPTELRVHELRAEHFEQFDRINSDNAANRRKPHGVWKALWPTFMAGRPIPVFFVGEPDKPGTFDMGLTQAFKIGHRYGVGEKIPEPHRYRRDSFVPDMVEALFGYVIDGSDWERDIEGEKIADTIARRGRVAFSFAGLENEQDAIVDQDATATTLMAPRASFAPFYLAGRTKDWSDPDAKLAGRKRYFPRFADASAAIAGNRVRSLLTDWAAGAADTQSRVKFLDAAPGKGLRFRGEIRFDNVTAAEIGLVLWALTHGADPAKPYRHMIGRARNAGAGQVRIARLALALEGFDDAANRKLRPPDAWEKSAENSEGWVDGESCSMAPFLDAFHSYMETGGMAFPSPSVLDFLALSKPGAVNRGMDYLRAGHKPSDPQRYMTVRKWTKMDTSMRPPATDRPRYLSTPTLPPNNPPYRA